MKREFLVQGCVYLSWDMRGLVSSLFALLSAQWPWHWFIWRSLFWLRYSHPLLHDFIFFMRRPLRFPPMTIIPGVGGYAFWKDSCDFILYRHRLFRPPVLFFILSPWECGGNGSGNLLSACMNWIRYVCVCLFWFVLWECCVLVSQCFGLYCLSLLLFFLILMTMIFFFCLLL